MIAKDNTQRIIWTNCEPVSADEAARVLAAFHAQEAIANERWTINPESMPTQARWLFALARGASIREAARQCGVSDAGIRVRIKHLQSNPRKPLGSLTSLRREGEQRSDESLWAFVLDFWAPRRRRDNWIIAIVRPGGQSDVLTREKLRSDAASVAQTWNDANPRSEGRAVVRAGHRSKGGVR